MDTVRPSAEVTPASRARDIGPEGGFRPEGAPPNSDRQRETLRVFIVSDVRLYREGLADLLGRISRIEVVGATGGADEGTEQVRDLQPDVVLLDTGTGGVAAAHYLLGPAPTTRVVALAAPESEEDVIALAEAGVLGYVTRDQSLDDLVMTIESVARGEMVCSPWMATVLVKRVQALAADRPPPPHGLTAREVEILELVAQGLANKEIAARLYIELTTVKNHVHNILGKLGVTRREEAVARMRASFLMLFAAQIAQEIQILTWIQN
jgi:two-component system, NarL family, nitrate/nitrite response regulator NarL